MPTQGAMYVKTQSAMKARTQGAVYAWTQDEADSNKRRPLLTTRWPRTNSEP